MSEPCYVYVIEPVEGERDECDPIYTKIGISNSPWGRLDQINTSNALRHQVTWHFKFPNRDTARRIEQYAHKLLDSCRKNGEWFEVERYQALYAIFDAIMVAKVDRAKFFDWPETGFSKQMLDLCISDHADHERLNRKSKAERDLIVQAYRLALLKEPS